MGYRGGNSSPLLRRSPNPMEGVPASMLKSEITPRTDYALREKRVSSAPLQRVRIIEHIRGNKWKAQWIDPNPGLIDYVESGHLICRWKEHKAFLKEEAGALRLRERNAELGYDPESPLTKAVEQVFETVGDEVHFYKGILSGSAEGLERVKLRAGLPSMANFPGSYTSRGGTIHLPFDYALELARKFCAAEPLTVLVSLETTEREWTRKAATPGEEYIVPLLNDYRASWALLRQWAGYDAAVAQREAEIQRLERLVWDAVYALQKAGLDNEAARLRRAIEIRR